METPSSTTRRITRSQALAASNNNNIPTSKKFEDSEKGTVQKSRPRNGSQPLIDITNDSPIIGIAMGKLKTPSSASALSKNRGNGNQAKTPGSGEALLRGQVKTLLQRVEEESEFSKKLSLEVRPFLHLKSPAGLLAPTPVNTPQVLSLSGEENFRNCCLASVTPSPVQEQLMISQMVTEIFEGKEQEGAESERSCLITRSLLLDFSEKSEGSSDSSSKCSSVLTHEGEGGESREKTPSTEDDDSSVWSIQVNASAKDDEEDFDCVEDIGEEKDEEDSYDYEEAEEEDDDGGWVDALCEGMSKINVYGEEKKMANFTGRHTRFVYNSDDELVEGEEEFVLKLKGLPTPKGKHFRFPEEDEEN